MTDDIDSPELPEDVEMTLLTNYLSNYLTGEWITPVEAGYSEHDQERNGRYTPQKARDKISDGVRLYHMDSLRNSQKRAYNRFQVHWKEVSSTDADFEECVEYAKSEIDNYSLKQIALFFGPSL